MSWVHPREGDTITVPDGLEVGQSLTLSIDFKVFRGCREVGGALTAVVAAAKEPDKTFALPPIPAEFRVPWHGSSADSMIITGASLRCYQKDTCVRTHC